MRFTTKIFHPSFTETGYICVDILQEKWKPILTMGPIIMSIFSLMMDY